MIRYRFPSIGLVPVLVLVAAPLLLAGCGGNKEDDLLPVIKGVAAPNEASSSEDYNRQQIQKQKSMYKPGSGGYPRPKR
jgi:hypothetical protein